MKKHFLSILGLATLISLGACKDDEPQASNGQKGDDNQQTQEISIPTYEDDYRKANHNSWNQRSQWNLDNVHDPTIAFFDGYYYMYQTDASFGNVHEGSGGHYIGRRSKDLVNWEVLDKPAVVGIPDWIYPTLNDYRSKMGLSPIANPIAMFWAPVVRACQRDGKPVLRMYYCLGFDNYIKSGKTNGDANFDGSWVERFFIGMRETTDPVSGVWTDYGMVVTSSSDKGLDYSRQSLKSWDDAYFYFNAIDPTYVSNDGKDYLIYGSWHSGIAAVEINPNTGMPVKEVGLPWADSPEGLEANGYGKRIYTRGTRWQGSEGPEIIYANGYYYLFLAHDGLDVPYNTRVVRSKDIYGPYVDMLGIENSSQIFPIVTHPYKFMGNQGWVGISHVAVFQKENTDDYFLCCQARLPENPADIYANAVMMGHVRKLIWVPSSKDNPTDLWPIASPERYAGEKQTPISESELVGSYEHINLVYQYRQQCESSAQYLKLKENHTYTGPLGSGSWSYDAQSQLLTIGDYIVKVERGVDWEATVRKQTLVYAGVNAANQTTFWGKKVK